MMQNMLLFVITSLVASWVAIDKFIAVYWFALVVLAAHPVIMFNWTLWFLRSLKELRG